MDKLLILICTDKFFLTFPQSRRPGNLSEKEPGVSGGFLQTAGSELSISFISAFRTAKLEMHSGAIFGERLCDLSSLPPSILLLTQHQGASIYIVRCYHKSQCEHRSD